MADVVRPSVWKLFTGLAFVAVLIAGLIFFIGGGTNPEPEAAQPAGESSNTPAAADPDLQVIDAEVDKVSAEDFGEGGLSDKEIGLSE